MRFMGFVSFFLFICCTTYANENKYIFIGQNETAGLTKTAFILELIGDDLGNHFQIGENGDVYLKVDKIVAISKEAFSHFSSLGEAARSCLTQNAIASLNNLQNHYEEKEISCSNCRFYYIPRPGHRDCPRCGTVN